MLVILFSCKFNILYLLPLKRSDTGVFFEKQCLAIIFTFEYFQILARTESSKFDWAGAVLPHLKDAS